MKSFFGQLLCGGENIDVDADLLFDMANRLGVSIPIRTKGWIRTSTITVSDGQVSAYQYSGGRSSAFFKYANPVCFTAVAICGIMFLEISMDGGVCP